MSDRQAPLVEFFSSIQGEGLYVGHRQVFLRLAGCNLSCAYCDTEGWQDPATCQLEQTPGRRDFTQARNPVTLEQCLAILQKWELDWPGIHHSLSITGGEPLINADALEVWLPELRHYLPIYLETNGTLHSALERVLHHVDIISMDVKLPSSSGCPGLWECHRDFLRVAVQAEVFVKIVVNQASEDWEIEKACKIVADASSAIPLILQPETSPDCQITLQPLRILELQEIATRFISKVRVIPQTHKFMGQL